LAQNVVKTSTGEHGTVALPAHHQKVRVWMQVVVSFLLLAAGFLVLVSPARIFPAPMDESTKKLAAGWIGAVIGYWLS
jgi:hypothetical protein